MWPKPSGNYWSCEDIVGVVGDTLGVFSVATMVAMAAAFNASSFAEHEVTALKSEVTLRSPASIGVNTTASL